MKGKIIYVDFIKKRRITFIHFVINKIITLFFTKLNVKTNSSQDLNVSKSRHILN